MKKNKILNKSLGVELEPIELSKIQRVKISNEAIKSLKNTGCLVEFPEKKFQKWLKGENNIERLFDELCMQFLNSILKELNISFSPNLVNGVVERLPLVEWIRAYIPLEKQDFYTQKIFEFQILQIIAAKELESLIEQNNRVLSLKSKQKLIHIFFKQSFDFHNGSSLFRVGEMCKFILKKGFPHISSELKKMETDVALQTSNEKLKVIKDNLLSTKLGGEGYHDVLKREEEFWENQKDYHQTKFELEKNKKGTLKNQSKGNTNIKLSYQWNGRDIEIELIELYNKMLGEWIDKGTTYEQFKAIFTSQRLDKITPIKWCQNNASEVLYFIKKLEDTFNIEKKRGQII